MIFGLTVAAFDHADAVYTFDTTRTNNNSSDMLKIAN